MKTETQSVQSSPSAPIETAIATESTLERARRIGRDGTIAAIRAALKKRTGKLWSVSGGRGTAYGWLTISAPPARRTWDYVETGVDSSGRYQYRAEDVGIPFRLMGPEDRAELERILGVSVARDGISIPSGSDYYAEFIDRAEGRTPSVVGRPYWD